MSTALNLIAPAAAAASAGERADELRLLAAVAAAIVRGAIAANPREQALFAIGDLPPDQTSAMALAVAEVPGAEVHVHPERSDGSLPPALLSRATAAHWRNMRRSDGPGAIVYAVPTRDAETVGTTVATIVPLATDTLLERPELWVEAIGRPIDERQKDWLVEALRGVVAANLALDLPMFARFVRRFFRHYADENVPAHRALAAALPALRLPSGAGSFKEAGKRGRVQSAARWRAELEEIRQKVEDRLYLRTDRGGRLPVEALKERVAQLEAEGGLDAAEARVVRALLDRGPVEPGIWAPEQAAVCELPWDKVEPVFTRGGARKEPLGKATADFFAKMFPTRLTGEEREDLLPRVTRENREPLEDERDFFFRHKDELLADKKLYARWEKFVFKGNEQHEDLLAGLFRGITDLLRTTPERPADPRLYVRLPEADDLRFWEKRNISLCCYLRDRYRGLDRLLAAEGIVLDFGLCWAGDWEASLEGRRGTSTKKQAREFKIEIYLLGAADLPAGGRPDAAALRAAPKGQIVWLPPGEALLATFTHDLHEIALLTTAEPLVALTGGRFSRNPKADRALDRAIRLDDRNSILDAYDESEGNLVNTERDDLGVELARSLVDLEARGVLPRDVAARLRERLQVFHQAYSAALRGLLEPQGLGLADEALLIQAERYGELLEALRATARVDECRSRLWAPALSIGIAMSGDTPPAAIVAPWQPLRLAELAVKARQAAATCGMALRSGFEGNADAEIFFEAKATALGTSFYPEVCLHASRKGGAWGGFRLLAETAALGGYGLCEPPTVDQGADGLFEGFPKEAVDAFMQVADEYLALQPHERANFSTVLLNAEARGLPGALAERLARKIERESDLRCDLVMTHTDRARLREIYEQQNTAIGREIDSALASEATRTFLSRLRVGILDVGAGNGAAAARQADLVLMQDVVARSAKAGWRPAPGGTFPPLAGHDPTSGSRRCPYDKGALSSAVHLAAPRQPRGVQAYLDLLHDLLTNDRTEGAHHWVPVREVAFTDPTVRNVLDTAHAVGEWVFSYDAIADRRLLRENGIKIIRFQDRPDGHHATIVSTRDAGPALRQRLFDVLGGIARLPREEAARLVARCLDDAALISGRVVLQAARLENSALELLGLVLSRQVAIEAFGAAATPCCWLLLDDIGGWLGHPGGELADILAIGLANDPAAPRIELMAIESKCVGVDGVAAQAAKSRAQLEQTVRGLRRRLLDEGNEFTRPIWLQRLADLLLEHAESFDRVGGRAIGEWVGLVRAGAVPLSLRGLSCVFVHDQAEAPVIETAPLDPDQGQLVLYRDQMARLLRRMLGGVEPGLPPTSEAPGVLKASEDPATASECAVAPARVDPTPEAELPESSPAVPEPSGAGHLPEPLRRYIEAYAAEAADDAAEAWKERAVNRLRQALRGYGMDAKLKGARLTPNAALVRLEGSDHLTVEMVEKRRTQLLTSHGLDVIGVRPAPGEIVVMVRREQRAILRLPALWARRRLPETAPSRNTSLLIGAREDDGEILYLNLAEPFAGQPQHGPHTLIAGETGSGKGVLTQNLLLDICATNAPESARIWLVDPKHGGDYPWIRRLPHLGRPIVTKQDEAIEALKALTEEMERRYEAITAVASNMDGYNRKVAPEARLPRLFFVHDELGDWMADKDRPDYREAVESYVVRLASKARAAGIHLILITQRPDKDALPGQIKANMNNKLCLRVSSKANSLIVLDEVGAELLLGQGHLAAKLANERPSMQSGYVLAQVPFATEEELDRMADLVADYWRGRASSG